MYLNRVELYAVLYISFGKRWLEQRVRIWSFVQGDGVSFFISLQRTIIISNFFQILYNVYSLTSPLGKWHLPFLICTSV